MASDDDDPSPRYKLGDTFLISGEGFGPDELFPLVTQADVDTANALSEDWYLPCPKWLM